MWGLQRCWSWEDPTPGLLDPLSPHPALGVPSYLASTGTHVASVASVKGA